MIKEMYYELIVAASTAFNMQSYQDYLHVIKFVLIRRGFGKVFWRAVSLSPDPHPPN